MSNPQDLAKVIGKISNGSTNTENGLKEILEVFSSQETSFEGNLSILWAEIIDSAASSKDAQPRLVDLLVSLSKQPDVRDDSGNPRKIYDAVVWKDLPMLGWEVNSAWNSLDIPQPTTQNQSQRSQEITSFTNTNTFISSLIKTNTQVFQPFKLQLLWTFRQGLEIPFPDTTTKTHELEIWIPAIHAILEVLGSEIKNWTDEYGNMARGGGQGEIWNGKQGWDGERWGVWKGRLSEIGNSNDDDDDGVSEDIRELALKAVKIMDGGN